MTVQERETLWCVAKAIQGFASMQHASFSCNEERDKDVKDSVRPYMTWAEIFANNIFDVIGRDSENVEAAYMTGYERKMMLQEIRCHTYSWFPKSDEEDEE